MEIRKGNFLTQFYHRGIILTQCDICQRHVSLINQKSLYLHCSRIYVFALHLCRINTVHLCFVFNLFVPTIYRKIISKKLLITIPI